MPGQLRLTASDRLSGVQSIAYQLDGGAWTQYSDNVNFKRTLSVPAIGDHVISIQATNGAGVQTELDDQPFTVLDVQVQPTPTPSDTPTQPPTTRPQPAGGSAPTPAPAQPRPTSPPPPAPPPPFNLGVTVAPTNVTSSSCPVTINFTGTITYTGSGGTFQYTWVRSDGAMLVPPNTVTFTGPGTVAATGFGGMPETWTLGDPTGTDPRFRPFNGWEELKILSPTVFSNQAAFQLTCDPPQVIG
jgi:hypothetical protein